MIGELPATVSTNSKGKSVLPDEPFSNSGELRTYASAMISAENKRSEDRSVVEGVLAGFQPINPASLAAKKLSWMPNTNYLEMQGYIHAPQTAFYDLVTEASPCIEAYLDYGNGQEKTDWEESIARNFTWLMLHRWRMEFNFHVPMCQREMLVHGLGCHVWPQQNIANWIERTPRTGHILFPEDSPVDFENEGEAFMLRDFVTLKNLHSFIKNEAAATKLGWNTDVVWKTMAMVSKGKKEGQRGDNLEAYVRQMKRGDQGGGITRTSGVWIDWVFVREIGSSKVSLYAVPEGVEPNGYLFKKRNLYDNWPLAMFPYDIGNGTLHSIRGLGVRSRDFFQLSNRIKNTMAAQVLLGSTVLLQQTGTFDPVKTKLLKMGMMSILPQNLQIAQGFRFPDLSQGPLALDQNLHDTLRTNTQAYASGAPEAKDRETALSYQMRSQDSSQVSKGAHGLYGSHLCNYWNIKLKMILKAAKMIGDKPYITMAKEFTDRCKKDRVPDEALNHICEIREVMSTGAGSAAARIQSFLGYFQTPAYLNTTDDRKVNIERDFTAAMFAGAKVDRYARSLNDDDMTTDDDSIIALENDALSRGGQAVVSPHQNQVRHAQGHLQAAGGIVQALQQGQMQPEEALGAIKSFGQHTAAHLQKIKENPTKEADYKALQKELLSLASIADKLQQNVDEANDNTEPSPQQQLSEKGQLDLMKAQSQEQVRNVKAKGHEQRAWEKLKFDNRVAAVRTTADIRRQNLLAVTQ